MFNMTNWRGERALAKGLDYLARGRGDLAQIQFNRAERLGIDVVGRLRNIATEDLKKFKQKVEGVKPPPPSDLFAKKNEKQKPPNKEVTGDTHGVSSFTAPKESSAEDNDGTEKVVSDVEVNNDGNIVVKYKDGSEKVIESADCP